MRQRYKLLKIGYMSSEPILSMRERTFINMLKEYIDKYYNIGFIYHISQYYRDTNIFDINIVSNRRFLCDKYSKDWYFLSNERLHAYLSKKDIIRILGRSSKWDRMRVRIGDGHIFNFDKECTYLISLARMNKSKLHKVIDASDCSLKKIYIKHNQNFIADRRRNHNATSTIEHILFSGY